MDPWRPLSSPGFPLSEDRPLADQRREEDPKQLPALLTGGLRMIRGASQRARREEPHAARAHIQDLERWYAVFLAGLLVHIRGELEHLDKPLYLYNDSELEELALQLANKRLEEVEREKGGSGDHLKLIE